MSPYILRSFCCSLPGPAKDAWLKPPTGSLKFNIDGAVVEGFGKADIRRILRNEYNESLLTFSKYIGFTDATSAELLAFKEACVLFGESKWVESHSVIFESDCSLVFRWLTQPNLVSSIFKQIVLDCLDVCSNFRWSLNIVPRTANPIADKLAKTGTNRSFPWVWKA
ncbi:hypothetical protein V6N11_050460 [Hibiscus sabdariffa]|uniref:RNase H type-1 domain-containing protein n=1 Tax=Hibiscus sabdariffa TaxID=183260 RepID=A0ABR2TA10_9ROSI